MHRDIKLDNILIKTNGNACLCDFGSAEDLTSAKGKLKKEAMGLTLIYCPPEVLRHEYGLSGDIWALGQLIYCMVAGEDLF